MPLPEHGKDHAATGFSWFSRWYGGVALGALAQQSGKIWRMGFIAHGHERFYDALFEGLQEFGYVEGQNLIVERRYAEGRAETQNLRLRWFD
jgi:hypothetical protein